ncbi:solute carrier family 27 member 3 [Ornithorhynchus anatinus]|uniref:long-chain-fatty-acid--CoA ligase n=1 Tax=Ornithorhynchus anatinus TaxID=9258 RepID=A0A6I8P4Q6_ORNAN|nr:solute carrier family 27 member 3 [Ornithorhynchus anatinus]
MDPPPMGAVGVVLVLGVVLVTVFGGRLRWLPADLAFAVRSLRCKRALRAAAARAGAGSGAGGCSLGWRLAQLSREQPDRAFLLHGGRRYSYAQAERSTNRAARAFLRRHAEGEAGEAREEAGEAGAVVALLLPSGPEFVWLWLGLAKAGLRAAFLPAALRRAPLLHCLRTCRAGALVVAPEFLESLEPDLPALRSLGLRLWSAGPGPASSPLPAGFNDLLAQMEEEGEAPLPGHLSAPADMLDASLYIFTSGTTGLPKAARVSHLKVLQCQGFYRLCGATRDDVIYLALPLYHMSGSLLGIVGCLGIGATVVLKTKFSASQFWDDCRAHGVTVFQYIGELCRYIVNQPPSPSDRAHKVRLAVGSGLRPDVWERFLRRFGPLRVLETYGLTEGNVALFNYTGRPGAVGRDCWLYKRFSPFSLIRYDAAAGQPLRDARGLCVPMADGEPGLLVSPVSPTSPFLGYTGGPELARGRLLSDVQRPGDLFFNTGDLLCRDAHGFLTFHDRTGDTFRWKGENVATTEVALTLGALEFLQDVGVYGVTVPGHEGRAGMAALVPHPDRSLDLARLHAHVTEMLPPYARPRFLRLQAALPTTETFKQQKTRLAGEGFDPGAVSDPLFVLDQEAGAYVALTPARHRALLDGRFRL